LQEISSTLPRSYACKVQVLRRFFLGVPQFEQPFFPSPEGKHAPGERCHLAGDGARFIEYCKDDTLETLLVFLSWGHHCGWMPLDQFAAFVQGARDAVARESFAGWNDLGPVLQD